MRRKLYIHIAEANTVTAGFLKTGAYFWLHPLNDDAANLFVFYKSAAGYRAFLNLANNLNITDVTDPDQGMR